MCFHRCALFKLDLCFQEVTLRRSHCEEKLGLTLCYASPDDPETNIFVSEVSATTCFITLRILFKYFGGFN